MSSTRKSTPSLHSYNINKDTVAIATQYKCAGIIFTANLSWSQHITSVSAKASKSLGYLRRNLRHAPANVRKLAYLTLVRPQLEYASPIWSPHQKYLTDMLERIQNRASRFISNDYSHHSSVTQIKLNLSLQSLSTRRDIALLTLFHKFIHSSRTTLACLKRPYFTSHRLHNHFSYTRIYGSTLAFNCSALPRAVRYWNSLPDSIACLTNIDAFRDSLTSYLANEV